MKVILKTEIDRNKDIISEIKSEYYQLSKVKISITGTKIIL